MANYKGILFQRDGESVYNSSNWGCYVTDSPYIPVPTKPKNITSQSWFDEHGDDEYIPATLYYEAVEATINFVYKGSADSAKEQIKAFIDYLRGGVFKFYDEYYKIGRQNARLVDFSDNATLVYEDSSMETCVAQFAITIKINDPVTDIVL